MRNNTEGDHWPVPDSLGGTFIIRTCITCHNIKDRVSFSDLPTSFTSEGFQLAHKLIRFWFSLNREQRIMLARYLDTILRTLSLGEEGVKQVIAFIDVVAHNLASHEVKSGYYKSLD